MYSKRIISIANITKTALSLFLAFLLIFNPPLVNAMELQFYTQKNIFDAEIVKPSLSPIRASSGLIIEDPFYLMVDGLAPSVETPFNITGLKAKKYDRYIIRFDLKSKNDVKSVIENSINNFNRFENVPLVSDGKNMELIILNEGILPSEFAQELKNLGLAESIEYVHPVLKFI